MNEQIFLATLVLLSLSFLIPVLFALSSKLGPKSTNSIKEKAYESGVDSVIGSCGGNFSVKYYLIAIIFVIFDIEILFMYPWAVNLRDLGLFGIIEMFTFMSILIMGLIYVYGKRVLKWS